MRRTTETDREWANRMVAEKKLTPEGAREFEARALIARDVAKRFALK